jgi:hypothetical protein
MRHHTLEPIRKALAAFGKDLKAGALPDRLEKEARIAQDNIERCQETLKHLAEKETVV